MGSLKSSISMKTLVFPFFLLFRSLKHRKISSLITILSIALASGLVLSVLAIQSQSRQAFAAGSVQFDAVLGARGSQLQLVLNSLFHLETSPGNIPWSLYKAIQNNPQVALAVPMAVGDNYRNFRIVGTTLQFFESAKAHGKNFYTLGQGQRFFSETAREAVIGHFVAQRTGLKPGSVFNPYHGMLYDEKAKHADEYVVTGILEPSNTPNDRAIFIPIEGIFRMEGHVLRGAGQDYKADSSADIPDDHKEVSAVLLKLKSPQAGMNLDQTINKQGKIATLAWPIARVIADLFDKMGWVHRVLELVSWLVVLVAMASILSGLYNTMQERLREFAILRALGAKRIQIILSIVMESSALALFGFFAGILVSGLILALASLILKVQVGVVLNPFPTDPTSVLHVGLAILLMGVLAGVLPALKAYHADVITNLAPTQ